MKEEQSFPSVQVIFQEINTILGGLVRINEERFHGNLKPTEMAVDVLNRYIQASPQESVVNNVKAIRLILGEEDCNTELLQGVENAIRARQDTETQNGHTKEAMLLGSQTLRGLITDSEEINRSMKSSPSTGS